jgi:hypothetical protein
MSLEQAVDSIRAIAATHLWQVMCFRTVEIQDLAVTVGLHRVLLQRFM